MSLTLLGLMRRANALSIGQDKALPCVKSGKAKLLLIPSDASERVKRSAENAVRNNGTELIQLPYPGNEISKAIGVSNCCMLAITDSGFAKSFAGSLNKL